jgi:subtilisin family serine protease
VNWTTSIMAAKSLSASGTGTVADAIEGIEFVIQAAAATGANVRVISNSWSIGGESQALLDEINRANASNMLFVVSAGNGGFDNDVAPHYPASYTAPNLIAVASTNNNDNLASDSNRGALSVHLAAPGVNILSTYPGGSYQYLSGTSMAAPHVSGAAALVLSRCALNTSELKANLLGGVDPIPLLAGRVITGGRLNVNTAIRSCVPLVAVPDVVSLTQVDATAAIATAGLTVGAITTASSTTVPAGSIISQTPAAGTPVTIGSAVALVVSSGAPPVSDLAVEQTLSVDGIGTRSTPSFSTTVPGELLLAFAASDGASAGGQTLTVSGGGLAWTLVQRANTQAGTAEIWRATAATALTNVAVTSTPTQGGYDQSLTVISFIGASGIGASAKQSSASGAPSVTLTTTRGGALVFGVGYDWDSAMARTVTAGQTMVHQWVDTRVGDSFWVQTWAGKIDNAGTSVRLSDTAPTNDRWNFASVEIVPR